MTSNKTVHNVATDTHVTFPANATNGTGTVIWAGLCEIAATYERGVILVDTTPFHPLDHTWPDQPGDHGFIVADDRRVAVENCVTAAVSKADGSLYFGSAIPARRGDPGWSFVVAHVLGEADSLNLANVIGQLVELQVDKGRRRSLSAAHTACHVMSLALNEATESLWHKDVQLDSLGSPNFDQLAIAESRITLQGSLDRYRVGKSLRKKGLDTTALIADLQKLPEQIDGTLADWLKAPAPVWVDAPTGVLSEVRTWHCTLSAGDAHLPCGGTHLRDLKELKEIRTSIQEAPEEPEFTVHTIPTLAK